MEAGIVISLGISGVQPTFVTCSGCGISGHVLSEPTQGLRLRALVLLTGHVATFLGSLRTPARLGRSHYHSSLPKSLEPTRLLPVCEDGSVIQRGDLGRWPMSNGTAQLNV